MSLVYLFRHGQAGSRDDYDRLSELGTEQAELLGDHLAREGVRFSAFFMGGLRRQQETAARIVERLRASGAAVPHPQADLAFSEFDLDQVYRILGPKLAAESDTFRTQYEDLAREAADSASPVHRRWTQCDIDVVRAWIEGRHPCDGAESWSEFTERVRGGLRVLEGFGTQDAIGISTSATPIGIWMGLALRLEPLYIMRAAGALYNASFSVFRLRQGELHLSSFNNIPHLKRPELRTHR